MMTASLWILPCLMIPALGAPAQEADPVPTPSSVERVTVYQGQALVERIVTLDPDGLGLTTLAIGPLPLNAQSSSLQTEILVGNAVVQGLELRQRRGGDHAWSGSESLRSELEELQWQAELKETEYRGVEAAIQGLLAIAKAGHLDSVGASDAVIFDSVQLDSRLAYFQRKMTELQVDAAKVRREREVLLERIRDLEAQMNMIDSQAQEDYREARISLFVEQAGSVRVKLSYLVEEAWWQPAYDVRVAPDLTGVNVGFVGQVTQRTGEDWDGVELVLSTSTPSIGLDPPKLPRRHYRVWGEDRAGFAMADADMEMVGASLGMDLMMEPSLAAPMVAIQDFGLTTQFLLPGETSVRSNGEAHRFRIRELPLEVKPERYVVPSMSNHAYLRALVTHTGDAPLLSGTAKVFLGPDYLGEASFPILRQGESTMLNLGIDPMLTVEWETVEDSRENPGRFSLSSTATITRRYRATLHLSAAARSRVSVLIEESLPLSWDDRVEVDIDVLQPKPLATDEDMELREERGLYRWRLSLAPGATQGIRWGYELSFDEDLAPYLQEN